MPYLPHGQGVQIDPRTGGKIIVETDREITCYSCGVSAGEQHADGCPWRICAVCLQGNSCKCADS
jgi:hypothetical protein